MCMLRNCKHGLSALAASVQTGDKFRLPRHILPRHYDLELTPDFDNLTFFGSVAIDIDVLKPSSEILINTKDLRLGKVTVEKEDGTSLEATFTMDEELQRATLKFAGTVGKGAWRLKLSFAGTLNDELKGFYRSVWTDAAGVEHVIATTQFEATDARRAFPCFDEPNMKATFKVTLNVPHGYQALSSMRSVGESTISVEAPQELAVAGVSLMEPRLLKRVEFAVTPKMSTYYLAFMAGELAMGGSVYARGVELRFWTIPGSEHQLDFAQRVGAFAYNWLEDYCQTKYIGDDKIDFVAVPDFAAGAMENLGCIIYRMTDLLLDEATATQDERERVAHVVVHELVHMRFGDDATMDWWDNLWLNESFATLLENMGVDAMFPEWKTWETFASSRASAFDLDQLHSTHPIQVAVDNPFQIDEIFDLISYEKGCSVLRMIEQFVGAEAFRAGVRTYLKRHHLGNTVGDDLWLALEEGCAEVGVKVPVAELMNRWVFTSGHPIVTVEASDKPGFVRLTQKEFKVLARDGSSPLWPIPVKLRAKTAAGVTEEAFILSKAEQTVYVGEGMEWVVVNAYGDGFYRVKYGSELLAKLLPVLKTAMGNVEQYNLLNDAWSATRACQMGLTDFLKLVDYMGTSDDPNVWECIAEALTYLHSVLTGPIREAVAGKTRALFKPLYAKLGAEARAGEDTKRMKLRTRTLRTLGVVGSYQPVLDQARAAYTKWKQNPASVDSDIFEAMLVVLTKGGDAALYDEFDKLRLEGSSPQEKERFMMLMTRFTDKALVERSLDLVLSGGIRVQDAVFFLSGLLSEEDASVRVWEAIKENWAKLNGMWPEAMVARLFRNLSVLDSPEQEQDVLSFFAAHPVETTKMQLAQGLEQLRINVSLRQAVAADQALPKFLLPAQEHGCIPPAADQAVEKPVDGGADASASGGGHVVPAGVEKQRPNVDLAPEPPSGEETES
ncbi:MAG TPA: M1 family metallopeptidase [Candidatus Obscuribacter sp.]|nr:M1 family metallopeptidase [Candidatus Obscuribacter sp.]